MLDNREDVVGYLDSVDLPRIPTVGGCFSVPYYGEFITMMWMVI